MALALQKKTLDTLHVGDKITVAITHEVKINNDKAWIKYEATSAIDINESTDDAKARVVEHVSQSVVYAAIEAAKKVMEQ